MILLVDEKVYLTDKKMRILLDTPFLRLLPGDDHHSSAPEFEPATPAEWSNAQPTEQILF